MFVESIPRLLALPLVVVKSTYSFACSHSYNDNIFSMSRICIFDQHPELYLDYISVTLTSLISFGTVAFILENLRFYSIRDGQERIILMVSI